MTMMIDKKNNQEYTKDMNLEIEEVPFEELTLDEYLEISSFEDEDQA